MNTILQLLLRKCAARFVSSLSSSRRPPLINNFLSPICGLQFLDYNRLKRSQMVTSKQLKFINRTLNNPSYRWSPIRRQSGSTMPIWDQHNKCWCESTVIKSLQWGRCTQKSKTLIEIHKTLNPYGVSVDTLLMEVEDWFFNFHLSSWSSSQEIALRATDSWWTCTQEVLNSLYTQKICTPKIKTTEIGAHPGDNTKLILNLDFCTLSCTVQTNWPQTCPLSVGRPILSDTSPIALHPKNENPISSWWVATF